METVDFIFAEKKKLFLEVAIQICFENKKAESLKKVAEKFFESIS